MRDLRGLIEKLEKLEEPDRAVDAQIDVTLFGGETVWKTANYTMELYPASRRPSKHHVGGFANEHVPLVTASLDAAITLCERVLPDARWEISTTGMRPGATVISYERRAREGAYAATPAIALVLATLRALSDQGKGQGEESGR